MSQYSIGTVDVTNGSAIVTGIDTVFLTEVIVGDLFVRLGDTVSYDVASVDTDLQITLSTIYAGVTGSGVVYAISRDFTPLNGIPFFGPNDIATATIFKRAMALIDGLMGGKVPQSYYLDLYIEGIPADEEVIFDGFFFDEDVDIKEVTMYAREAPTGANFRIDFLKGGTPQVKLANIVDGSKKGNTVISGLSYTVSEEFGIKVEQVGSVFEGNAISIKIHYAITP